MEKSLKRRVLLGTLLAAPFALRAQPRGKKFKVAFLQAGTPSVAGPLVAAVREALKHSGYIEGRDIEFVYGWAEGDYARLPALAKDLVKQNPDVIHASTTPVVHVLQQITGNIPVVMVSVSDPVTSGFVQSLARPGGNITGVANLVGETSRKQLELLVATFPKLTRVSILHNRGNPAHARNIKTIESSAEGLSCGIL